MLSFAAILCRCLLRIFIVYFKSGISMIFFRLLLLWTNNCRPLILIKKHRSFLYNHCSAIILTCCRRQSNREKPFFVPAHLLTSFVPPLSLPSLLTQGPGHEKNYPPKQPRSHHIYVVVIVSVGVVYNSIPK